MTLFPGSPLAGPDGSGVMQWLYSQRKAAQSTTEVRAALSMDPPTTAPVYRRASSNALAHPGGTIT